LTANAATSKTIVAVCMLDRKEHNMQYKKLELDGYWVKNSVALISYVIA
jgi:hypothetical protein